MTLLRYGMAGHVLSWHVMLWHVLLYDNNLITTNFDPNRHEFNNAIIVHDGILWSNSSHSETIIYVATNPNATLEQ